MWSTKRFSHLAAGLRCALIIALVWAGAGVPAPIVSAAPQAEAAQIGYWALNETSGTTATDASNYGNTGAVTNGTWTAGHTNNALSFNGTSSRVTVPNSASINTITNRMTLAFWANASSLSAGWVTALQRSNAANSWFDWQLYLRASDAPTANRPVFRIDWNQNDAIDADEQVEGDIALAANTWYHIAVTYDGTAMRFYINGTQRGSTAHASSTIPNSTQPIWMGANSAWGEYLAGRLDEVYLYNRALSQAEIQALMSGAQYTLTVNVVGSGSVIRNLSQAQYTAGDVVFLRALPATNWTFSGWSGDLSGSANPTSITMNANRVITASFTNAGTSVQWTAFNDVVYDAAQANTATDPNGERVQYSAPNVTAYGIGTGFTGSTSGLLRDVTTGSNTSVTAAFTQNGSVAWESDTTSTWNGGYDTALGTDARNTFGGLADMVGTVRYGTTGWYVDLTITGLNPARRYTFATTASRAESTYTTRLTRYTLSSANSATNASTTGTNIIDSFNVAFNTGDNHANGYVARWTDIDPGADGSITIRAQAHDAATEYRAYAFDAFMLQEIAIGPVQQYTLTVNTVGNGSVTKNPDQAQYNDGTIVQLTGVPQSGYVFNGWSGDLSGSTNPTNITMSSNKVVTATFVEQSGGAVTRFATVGDFGDASTNEQNVANLINSWNPEFVITMGDDSYGSTTPVAPAVSTIDHNIGRYYSSYIGAYTGGFGSGSVVNRFFPSIGNHDYTDGGGITAYLNYFTLPGAGITTTNTSGNERYYDFVQGPVHFFAINSDANEPNGNTSTSPQGQWLQTRLAAATEPWKIVYFHHPPYSSGSVHGSTAWMQWPFQLWGADAVLAGHDHTYERIILNNLLYFVNGAGGHGLYTFNTPVTGSQVRYSANYGAMLVEASSITMTFKFYSIAGGGTLIDSYTITTTAPTDNNLVPAGSTWKYLDNGSNQGTTWNASAFDDSSWASGPAPLGYGDAMSTTVNCGPNAPTCTTNNYITTYFRRSFTVADPSIYSNLALGLRRDDGAVVYLNGTEITRSNMPVGTIAYNTTASGAIPNVDETVFFSTTLPNTLVVGTNVLAVEIHQASATSTDIGFDLRLIGVLAGPTPYNLTVNTVGSGSVSLNPPGGSYTAGTVVTLTAAPGSGYAFSSWSGDLTGSTNPTTITMSSNRSITATFTPGTCVPFSENFNGLTLGTRIGQVTGWTESGTASPAVVAGGLASTQGLGTGSSIFNWSAHPFTWTDPALNSVTFQMDFQANASGAFDDDRLAWMTENNPANSEYNFGIQLDPDTEGTICPSGQNIETYWRNPAFSTTTRIETTIACLPALTANGWYRAQLLVTKLTNTSARLDVALTALDGSGNPGAVVASGTVTDTSTWPGGAAPAAYFSPSGTSPALYPSYKNHSGTTGNADNAYADLCPVPTTQYTLTTNTVGSGTIGRNPNAATYAAGTIVTLTATPGSGYTFSGWSGDLTGSANPTTITMSSNRVVTATFVPAACTPFTENFNSLTLGTRIGQVAGWTESGTASPAVVADGLASTQGLGTGSSIFNWSAHPFTWTNPALTTVTFQMDFQANATGLFDDDRLAWMTENTPGSSQYNFGVQLDTDDDGTACPTGQNIETYWRNPAFSTTRVETTIACLPTLTANGWYRAQLLATKLTNTSARLDVTLTALDGSGTPGAVVASGTVTDTSTWPGGAAPAAYFSPSGTSTALYPSYKNHSGSGTIGNVDNAYANLCPAQYTLTVNTVGSGTVATNPNQAQYSAGTVVTLTATPNSGYVFSGWSGDLIGSANPTTITMNGSKVVTATFLAEVTRTLSSGWNLLALPLQPQTALTAESLLDDIASQGGTCSEAARWSGGTWVSHIKDLPVGDFSLALGQAYFVRCAGTDFSWSLRGTPLVASVSVTVLTGWNLLSVPYPTGLFAQDVLTGIVADGGTCSELDRWTGGTWNAHLFALPSVNNFAIAPNDGYFVRCTTGTTYTP